MSAAEVRTIRPSEGRPEVLGGPWGFSPYIDPHGFSPYIDPHGFSPYVDPNGFSPYIDPDG